MRFRIIAAAFLVLAALASCKKEETTKVYMDGTLALKGEMPRFVVAGSSYSFSASGITAPDGTAVGYYFTDPVSKHSDTTSTYTYVVPDALGTYSLTCVAYAVESSDKYYSSSASLSFTIVSDAAEGGSLQGVPRFPDAGSAVLHGRKYDTVKSGSLEWLGSNLCYSASSADGKHTVGVPYADCPAMLGLLGGFYTWEDAQGVCPDGWRLPTDEEWTSLIVQAGGPSGLKPFQDSPSGAGNLMVKCTFNGSDMWEYYRGVDIRNGTHMNVIPAGYATLSGNTGAFSGFGAYAAFWTADTLDGKGVYRYIYQENDNVYVGLADKDSFAASVRCVR